MSKVERDPHLVPGYANGIDVSSLQGVIDWPAVRAAGFEFAIIRVNHGFAIDRTWERNVINARDAGLIVGSYHVMLASDFMKQPRFFADTLGTDTVELPPAIDIELPQLSAIQPMRMLDYLRAVEEEFGRKPIVYTYPNWWATSKCNGVKDFENYNLWIAHYKSLKESWAPEVIQEELNWKPKVPKPWAEWDIWQYSGNKGYKVPGVKVDCDRNIATVVVKNEDNSEELLIA